MSKIQFELLRIRSQTELQQFTQKILFNRSSQRLPTEGELLDFVNELCPAGKRLYNDEKYQQSILLLTHAQKIAKVMKNETVETKILCDLGFPYYFLKEYSQTILIWERAYNLSRQVNDISAMAEIGFFLSKVFREINAFSRLTKCAELALRDYRKLQNSTVDSVKALKFKDKIGQLFDALGLGYSYAGPIDASILNYQKSIKIAAGLGNFVEKRNRLGNLARTYLVAGEKELALDTYFDALKIKTNNPESDQNAQILGNMSLGIIYRELAKLTDAESHFGKALGVASKIGDNQNMNRLLNSLGIVFRDCGDLVKAYKHYKLGYKIARTAGDEIGEGDSQGNIGNYFYQTGQPAKAQPYYEKALQISRKYNDTLLISRWTGNLGNVCSQLGKQSNAVEFYREALALSQEIHDKDHEYLWNYNLGVIYRDQFKNPEEARCCFLRAILCLNDLRRGIRNEDFSRSFGENKVFVYQDMIDVCLELSGRKPAFLDDALAYAEDAKGYTLMRMITESGIQPSPVVPESLRKEFFLSQNRIHHFENKLSEPSFLKNNDIETGTDGNRLPGLTSQQQEHHRQDWLQKLTKAKVKQRNILLKIAQYDPAFAEISNQEKISIKSVQEFLDQNYPGKMIVFFSVTRDYLNIFLVTAQEIVTVRLPELHESALNKLVNDEWLNPYEIYRNKKSVNTWQQDIDKFSVTMYNKFWLKIEPHITKENVDGLIIIPSGVLYLLPFHLIRLPSEQNEQARYLSDDFQIAYAPNFRMLKLSQSKGDLPFLETNFLGICNPDRSLLWADLEMEVISNFFSESLVLWHETAQRKRILEIINRYSVVHFSTHAEGATFSELNVGMLTADGFLSMHDIFTHVKFPQSAMTVLSACETGMIKPDKGDEYIGLPAAFLYASVPSVVSSLWKVEDASTALLMIKFYENLKTNNMSRIQALSDAQNWLRTVTNAELILYLEPITDEMENEIRELKQKKQEVIEEINRKESIISNCREYILDLKWEDENTCRYSNPYYWGAFVISGRME